MALPRQGQSHGFRGAHRVTRLAGDGEAPRSGERRGENLRPALGAQDGAGLRSHAGREGVLDVQPDQPQDGHDMGVTNCVAGQI